MRKVWSTIIYKGLYSLSEKSEKSKNKNDIIKLTLDEGTVLRRSPEIESERTIAIYDILEDNSFKPVDMPEGPYHLHLAIEDNRLSFNICDIDDQSHGRVLLPIKPFKRIVKDYFMICETYYTAVKSSNLRKVEAIDMGRRGIHDEGAEMLQNRLDKEIKIDKNTARRLFTLVCILHIRAFTA